MTLRECMATGGRGDFAQALLASYEDPHNLPKLVEAFGRADSANRARMSEVFPALASIASQVYDAWPLAGALSLTQAFPALALSTLDEDVANPYEIIIG